MSGEANFTLIGGFNPAYVKKYGIQSAVNSDPDRTSIITHHISAIPNTLMCVVPYEVKDTTKSLKNTNFHNARWVCLDIDNNKLPDDKKWTREQIYNYLANRCFNFHICGSPTPGNYKVFIECEECDTFKKYEHFTIAANTMKEGLGDPDYQGRNTIVNGYLCGYTGGDLFRVKYNPTTSTTSAKKKRGTAIKAVNNGMTRELHSGLLSMLKGANTIKGRCYNYTAKDNGTYNLYLSDEKTPGGYFIRPDESIYIYKAGNRKIKYTPAEFFIDDNVNRKVYMALRELCNGSSSINMMMKADKDLGIEALCDRKIIRNDLLRKAGCKVKERNNKGKWDLCFIWQGTKYYSQNRADMMKLLKRLAGKVMELLNNKVEGWLSSLKNHVHGSKIYYSIYKGRTEEQINTQHNKMMEAIKGWFRNEKTHEKSIDYGKLRDMRIFI